MVICPLLTNYLFTCRESQLNSFFAICNWCNPMGFAIQTMEKFHLTKGAPACQTNGFIQHMDAITVQQGLEREFWLGWNQDSFCLGQHRGDTLCLTSFLAQQGRPAWARYKSLQVMEVSSIIPLPCRLLTWMPAEQKFTEDYYVFGGWLLFFCSGHWYLNDN